MIERYVARHERSSKLDGMMSGLCSSHGTLRRISISMLMTLLAVAIAPRLSAQMTEQKISPGRLVAEIPPGCSIQAAAALDRHLLAVWGSSVRRSDGTAGGSLWYQTIVDGMPVGSPAPVPDAVPERFLSVQSTNGRYVILWNDVRSGSTVLYCRIADTSGLLQPEHALWEGEISDVGIALFRRADGYRLVWSGRGENLLRELTVDPSGAPTGSISIVGTGAAGRIIEPAALPGYRIIVRGAALPLLFDAGGVERPLGSMGARLAARHAIGSDGTLAILAADTLCLYSSIIDTVASRTAAIWFQPGRIRGSELVQFDSSGRAAVLYAVGGGTATGPAEILSIDIHAVQPFFRDTIPFAFGRLLQRRTIAAPARSCEYTMLLPDSTSVIQGLGGDAIVSLRFGGSQVHDCQGKAIAEPISALDRFHFAAGEPLSDTLLPVAPTPTSSVHVERQSTPRGSTIIVEQHGDTTRLVAPAAERIEMRRERFPGITEIDGGLMVGWVSSGGDTSAMLGEWRPGESVVAGVDSIDLSAISVDASFHLLPSAASRIDAHDGRFDLATTHVWEEPNDIAGTNYRQRSSFLLPTAEGWQSIMMIDTTDPSVHPQVYSTSYDFKRREMLVAWGYRDPNDGRCYRVHLDAYDGAGRRTWSVDSVAFEGLYSFYTAPIEKNDFVWTEPVYFRRFRQNRIIDQVYVPDHQNGEFINLRYPYVFLHDPLVGTLNCRLFDMRGNMIGSIAGAPRPGLPSAICVLQDPVDSTIILLWGGHGITMARYDRTLRQIGTDRIISQTRDSVWRPAALFRGDTLHVVWEDYRGGISTLYGMTLPRALLSGVDRPAVARTGRMSVQPNPVIDNGTFLLSQPAGVSATLEIIDALGHAGPSLSVPPGAISLPLSTAGLPAGLYLARLRDGERIETLSFMVMR